MDAAHLEHHPFHHHQKYHPMTKLRASIFFRGTEDSTRGGTTCRGRDGGARCKRELHQVLPWKYFKFSSSTTIRQSPLRRSFLWVPLRNRAPKLITIDALIEIRSDSNSVEKNINRCTINHFVGFPQSVRPPSINRRRDETLFILGTRPSNSFGTQKLHTAVNRAPSRRINLDDSHSDALMSGVGVIYGGRSRYRGTIEGEHGQRCVARRL
jgi:hypothetical protein